MRLLILNGRYKLRYCTIKTICIGIKRLSQLLLPQTEQFQM